MNELFSWVANEYTKNEMQSWCFFWYFPIKILIFFIYNLNKKKYLFFFISICLILFSYFYINN
ncbi:MAG: hypothetical protein EAZ85_11185 [Bacteroidetes bacterium]|nr:MAG: hypothetical protein EAZ85_11185 [Bacteroidota bacterium]TAG87862.1 MAG: hypothetical protein EAZ20_09735 [Bacteroidota bacterium]